MHDVYGSVAYNTSHLFAIVVILYSYCHAWLSVTFFFFQALWIYLAFKSIMI